jgi:hypothetical protein
VGGLLVGCHARRFCNKAEDLAGSKWKIDWSFIASRGITITIAWSALLLLADTCAMDCACQLDNMYIV